MPGRSRNARSTLGESSSSGSSTNCERPRVARPAHDQLRAMLMALAQEPHDLIELQPRQRHIVHRHDLIARLQPGFGRRRSRQRLQNDDAPGQHRHDGAEALALGILHLLELLVLVRDRRRWSADPAVRSMSGNRALDRWPAGVFTGSAACVFHDGEHVGEALQRAVQVFGGRRRWRTRNRSGKSIYFMSL